MRNRFLFAARDQIEDSGAEIIREEGSPSRCPDKRKGQKYLAIFDVIVIIGLAPTPVINVSHSVERSYYRRRGFESGQSQLVN